jgi:hypothetical protein
MTLNAELCESSSMVQLKRRGKPKRECTCLLNADAKCRLIDDGKKRAQTFKPRASLKSLQTETIGTLSPPLVSLLCRSGGDCVPK